MHEIDDDEKPRPFWFSNLFAWLGRFIWIDMSLRPKAERRPERVEDRAGAEGCGSWNRSMRAESCPGSIRRTKRRRRNSNPGVRSATRSSDERVNGARHLSCHRAHDARSTSRGAKRSCLFDGRLPRATSSRSVAIAARVISSIGWAIRVGRSDMTSAQSRSSTPIKDTSSGQRRFTAPSARMTPIVIKLLNEISAVGGVLALMHSIVCS